GMEWVSLHRIPDAGELAQLAGPSLRIMGADPGGAVFARDALAALPSGQALAILLGSEESGLTTVSRAACSALVRIPGSGNLESLNVAQSAAVLLYELAAGQVSRLGEPQQRRPSRPTQRQKPGFPG
ncbi:MAG TPA: TrmH family RNA methyltransferase, partial [Magnetospirillaceae bacterium]|nr:TrmH family RNA methyltransferase [Magnetospirillaceae bacterium]